MTYVTLNKLNDLIVYMHYIQTVNRNKKKEILCHFC